MILFPITGSEFADKCLGCFAADAEFFVFNHEHSDITVGEILEDPALGHPLCVGCCRPKPSDAEEGVAS